MSSKIEKVLGLRPIDTFRKIPGQTPSKERVYMYVACDSGDDLEHHFKQVVRAIDPPIAKSGGVINEACVINFY